MPYFPPEIPPPPVVYTMQTQTASAADLKHQAKGARNLDARSQWPNSQSAIASELMAQDVATSPSQGRSQSDEIQVAESSATALEGTTEAQPRDLTEPHAGYSLAVTAARPVGISEIMARRIVGDRESAIAQNAVLPSLAAPWVAQANEPPADEPTDRPLSEESPESDEADSEVPETPSPFPRGATPEAFWSNGAVVEGGVLLPPSQPTNRPSVPLNLTADYQEFEPLTQILEARGNVVLRLGNGVLSADRLWANLANRFVLVEGNVIFTRGEQTIEAERGEYNLIQGQGSLFSARGVLFLPAVETDFGDIFPDEVSTTPGVLENDPISGVRSTGNITFGTDLAAEEQTGVAIPDAGGFVRRIRFEAEQLDFDSEGWYAREIRLTNDPFSPPELEFRGDTARLTRLTEFQDELFVENARIVFDQSFSVPLLRDRILLSRGGPDSANPLFFNIGFDGEDRDGLFLERSFRVATSGTWEFFLTPQLLAQRFVTGEDDNLDQGEESGFLSNFGLEADLQGALGPTTAVEANASFSGLDIGNFDDRLRASVRMQQLLGNHSLNLEYSYRDRLFNGSLGFQDVQSSLGVVLLSPNVVLGNTGIVLTYQASAQYITADTDRPELIDPPPFRDLVSLGRFQGSVALSRRFTLWRGERLPPTPDAGLRFTSTPRLPNLALVLGGRGTYTYYTSEDTQESLFASVGIVGELGQFSKDFFDSTVFNLTYRRSFTGEEGDSPFLFDRDVDQNVLSGGIIQQIYGPFRLGFQTSVNLDTGEVINTDYVFEYNRRTYSIVLRYNPTQSAGFLGFRLNEFDWSGRAPRFGGANIRQVDGGVVR